MDNGQQEERMDNMTEIIKAPVQLVGEDGDAWAIMGRTIEALRRVGNPPEVIEQYRAEAMSGNYDDLLRVTMEYTYQPDED